MRYDNRIGEGNLDKEGTSQRGEGEYVEGYLRKIIVAHMYENTIIHILRYMLT